MTSNIADTHAFPYTAVGLVADTIGGVAQHGSGVLIAPDEMLTAAHVVWAQGVGTASNLFVVPDLNGLDVPFGNVAVTDYHYIAINNANDAISVQSSQADFALLHLASSISGAANMVPIANFAGGTVHMTGYPDSQGVSSMVDVIEAASPSSTTSTLVSGSNPGSGTSGGPLWSLVAGGTAQAFGLESSGGFGSTAAAFSAPILALINSWIAADHAGGLSGAISVAVPKLLHSITTEAAPAGINSSEAALFDTFSYVNNNADVKAAGIDPLTHFASFGWHENRAPDPLFDPAFYLAHNADVAAAGIDPLLHYAMFGWKEGRDPSATFSTNHYLAVNQDVKLAGLDPLQHYLAWGVTEGRSV